MITSVYRWLIYYFSIYVMIFCAILQNRNAETHKRVSTPHSALSTHIQMYMHTQKQKNIQIHKNVHRHIHSHMKDYTWMYVSKLFVPLHVLYLWQVICCFREKYLFIYITIGTIFQADFFWEIAENCYYSQPYKHSPSRPRALNKYLYNRWGL